MIKNLKRIILCTLMLIMLIPALPAPATADTGLQGYVVANTMKVYQYPHQLSKLLGTMSYGESVRVLAWQDGWFRVQNKKGDIGYCEYGGLSRSNPNNLNVFGYVKEAGAFILAKPGPGYKVMDIVSLGDELQVVGMTRDKQWLRIKTGSGYGYVQASLVSKTPTWFSNGLITPD